MKRLLVVSAILLGGLALVGTTSAEAGDYRRGSSASGAEHPKSQYYRGKSQVRGYSRRRGGYSYSYSDSINTYGDARGRYGSASSFRDPMMDRQTEFGPFDHGFFFDSGIAPRGGDSPYLQ